MAVARLIRRPSLRSGTAGSGKCIDADKERMFSVVEIGLRLVQVRVDECWSYWLLLANST
jgi:hypothetical protein